MHKPLFALFLLILTQTIHSQAFITTWKTDNPGVSNNNQITIPSYSGGPGDFTINWGDGTSSTFTNGIGLTHTYDVPGTYTVEITGNFHGIYFNDGGDKEKILSVDQWGSIQWASAQAAFKGCLNLDVLASDTPDLSLVSSMNQMFDSCSSLIGTPAFNNWDVSNVTSMDSLFARCVLFNQDIGNWDVSQVTNFGAMFLQCTSFNQDIGAWDVGNARSMIFTFGDASSFNQDIGNWNLSNATSTSWMFNGASSFNQDISNWDVSNVTDMTSMFGNATVFNQPIGVWDVGNVTRMGQMFYRAEAFNQPIGNWKLTKVITTAFMFYYAYAFNQDITNWDVSSVTNMSNMFNGAIIFNQPIGNWDVGNVIDMTKMFQYAYSFNMDLSTWNVSNVTSMDSMFFGATIFDQNLGNWNVGKVNNMTNMFVNIGLSRENYDSTLIGWAGLPSLQNNVPFDAGSSSYCSGESARSKLIVDHGWTITDAGKANCPFITTWKTDNPGVSDDNQIKIPTFPGETYNYAVDWGDGNIDTNVTTDIVHTYASPGTYQVSINGTFPRIYFFDYSGDITTNDSDKLIEINQWGSLVWQSMESAFYGCVNVDITAQDLPNLTQVTNMTRMFRSCASLKGNASMNFWDVSNITNLGGTFSDTALFNQDIGKWDVSSVTSLNGTFSDAKAFNQNINQWDVGNVTNLGVVFGGASSFNQPLNNWDVSKVQDFHAAFSLTPFNQPLSNWNTSSGLTMHGMFSGAENFNQDIGNWDVSLVEYFSTTFQNARSFNQNISSWNTSNATDMSGMFEDAISFNQDISNWDTSNVTSMQAMFNRAEAFNQNIGKWNVDKVTTMSTMFWNAKKFNHSLRDWNVANIVDMSYMFNGAIEFNQNIGNWDTSKVTNMNVMFFNAVAFDQNLGNWDVSNVSDMTNMLVGTSLSLQNYDNTLIGWGNLPSVQSNVQFSAGNSQFCDGADQRQVLLDTYGWNISDGGKAPLCNEDNDADGVPDHIDACLDTAPGTPVNASGCDAIANDAIQVYVLTPSCLDSSDGAIELNMDGSGYEMDIAIVGEGITRQFDNVPSGSIYKITDLAVGTYSLSIAIPEIAFERNFVITINALGALSGKRQSLDLNRKTASYIVSGSKNYTVSVNGELKQFQFENTEEHIISLNQLNGETEIIITGESDCQGNFMDTFFVDTLFSIFPTITSDMVNLYGDQNMEISIFSMDGRLVWNNAHINKTNSVQRVLDLSSFRAGLYIVKIVSGEINKTVKIIKR